MLYCRRVLIIGVWAFGAALAILAYKFPFAGIVFGGLLLAALFGKKKPQQIDTLGSARFASGEEIKKAGMLSGGSGLILGRIWAPKMYLPQATKRLLSPSVPDRDACEGFVNALKKKGDETAIVKLNNTVHSVVFARTGAGKGVSLAIPFLLDCPDSAIILDVKGENALLSARHREKAFGHRVITLDPFDAVTINSKAEKKLMRPSDTFNVFDQLNRGSPLILDECNALGNALTIRTGEEKDPYWSDSGEFWLSSLCLSVALYAEPDERHLQYLRTILTNPGSRQGVIKYMIDHPDDLQGMVSRRGHQLANFKDKELAGVLNTINRFTSFLDSLSVRANTVKSSFDINSITREKTTVYLVIPQQQLRPQAALMRVWVNAFLKAIVDGGPQETNKIHLLLDEASSLGRLDILDDAVDKMRGNGLRMTLFYQSMGQLKKCWGEGGDQTLLSNCTQVFFALGDKDTAEYVSERLGEFTTAVASGGTNWGDSRQVNSQDPNVSSGMNRGGSSGWNLQARKLCRPEELTTMDPRKAITLIPGMPPIMTYLLRYFEETNQIHRAPQRMKVWAAAMSFLALGVATAILMAMIQTP